MIVNVVEGAVTAVVKDGNILANVERLNSDSHLEVEVGDVSVNVPPNRGFRWESVCLFVFNLK